MTLDEEPVLRRAMDEFSTDELIVELIKRLARLRTKTAVILDENDHKLARNMVKRQKWIQRTLKHIQEELAYKMR